MKFIVTLLTVTLATIATITVAEPYVGIGIGSAAYKADLSALGGADYDDTSTGTKLYGGYFFNKYYAAEASVYNFAEASVGSLQTGSGTVSGAVSMVGVGAYAVGMYPLSKTVNLMAKLGVLSWDADLRINNTKAKNDGVDLAYAVAATYAITKEFLLAAEWEAFNSDNPELSMFSVGFRFNFR